MTSMTPTELSRRFSIPGLGFEPGHGGLTRAMIHTDLASAELYLHGAHLTAWQPAGQEPVLWMSRASNFERDKAIRGGVPICFPWFGPNRAIPSAPAHGYARIAEWSLDEARQLPDGSVLLLLRTWIDPFLLSYHVECGTVLRLTLRTELSEAAPGGRRFEDALHTYFDVSDVRTISISGLEDADFIDKTDDASRKSATGMPIRIVGETDRVYSGTESACVLSDSTRKRRITVSKSGSRSTVVWNPWIDKSARMPDFGDEEWPGMVCIETANVGHDAVNLTPGESHSTSAIISVENDDR